MKNKYLRVEALKIPIDRSRPGIAGVHRQDVLKALGDEKYEQFGELFGCQTCGENGMYVYDVEAVLERMASDKLTGTQLHWD